MRKVRTAMIAAVGTLALAGAALAASDKPRMMLVALPDGSVQHIQYQGDEAPQIVLLRDPTPGIIATAFGADSPFADIERISAAMEANAEAMMRQAATMQAQMPAIADGKGIVMTNAAGQPVGVMHYSYVSSTTGADGCTQTVQISSDGGAGNQPKVIRTSAGSCGSATSPSRPATPTANAVPQAAPTITPVSMPRPLPAFTPSRT